MALATTLGELKKQGYQPKSIKQELRDNLISRIEKRQPVFEGIYGFDDTVIPDMERAILSKHNILLLGLRGQAKTRLARLMVDLLDEYIPIIEGSELNDDPMAWEGLRPISLHHSAKLTPGIKPLMAGTPAFGNRRYKLILRKMYDTRRKIRMLTGL